MLYRTNSQSRLFEEAMRRYGLKYHVVGGFSFYERAEIKDMISYLKVIHNPDDSISLLRVINTPVRGIGKTTIETLERVALETGLSLWGAIAEVINASSAARAVAALKSFVNMIEDGRAMLAGTIAETAGRDGSGLRRGRKTRQSRRWTTTRISVQTTSHSILAGDLGADEEALGVPPCIERTASPLAEEVEAGRLHDSRQDAGATTPTRQHC